MLTKKDIDEFFNDKYGLEEVIEEKIFPAIVHLETDEIIGTGFFPHSRWLTSNAHVLRSWEDTQNVKAFSLKDAVDANKKEEIVAQELKCIENHSFHGKIKENKLDITIMKLDLSCTFKNIPNVGKVDILKEKCHIFYAYYDDQLDEPVVQFVERVYPDQDSPMKHKHIKSKYNIICPQQGCSGAPVIKASIKNDYGGKNLNWHFEVCGMVYARCFNDEEKVEKNTLCSIMIKGAYTTLVDTILLLLCKLDRRKDMLDALKDLNNEDDQEKIAGKIKEIKILEKEHGNGMETFLQGDVPLDIKLEDFDRLSWQKEKYPTSFKNSWFCSLRGKKRGVKVEHLQSNFVKIINEINKTDFELSAASITVGDLRADLVKFHGAYKMDIQDNTGDCLTSSIFAQVNFSGGNTSIEGAILAEKLILNHRDAILLENAIDSGCFGNKPITSKIQRLTLHMNYDEEKKNEEPSIKTSKKTKKKIKKKTRKGKNKPVAIDMEQFRKDPKAIKKLPEYLKELCIQYGIE